MNTATASSGHLLFVDGSIADGTFECEPEQLPILNAAITSFSSLVNKHSLVEKQQPFTGEVSLIELLSFIQEDYDLNTPLLKNMTDCLLTVHRNSVTVH